ncbi:ribonuclease H-like domain-containing protein [Salibacterium salarium]|uniref:ribonuclease H-like domain-containing protein n=1 Tax=Salibacterium salarium TaxID=284579 RepID=UPI001639F0AA|nr:ribonuclease H-like domain-containing protein [Salibacterium salarium]
MKLKNKLNRMKHHMSHQQCTDGITTPTQNSDSMKEENIPFEKEWENLQATPRFLEDQYVIKREMEYPFDYYHGNHALGELFDIWQRWQKETAVHPLHPNERKLEDLLFFDTETTGLNSGAGNMIFLLGGAFFSQDKVHVNQFFLPGPEAEVPLYYYFLDDMNTSIQHLATFNGKAFDWPQLKTRYTFVRNQVPNLPEFGHFDLLHSSRRLFKHILPSCKLSVVESEILGFERENDTPGYLAPMLYFDYLNEQNPAFIESVLTHNEWDILSLITLYINLSDRVLRLGTTARESFEIGRWYEQMKEWKQAEWCYKKAVSETSGLMDWKENNYYALALVLKKQQRDQEAQLYFADVFHNEGARSAEAAVEMAKYMEHTEKDIEKALFYTKEAERTQGNNIQSTHPTQHDIEKRKARLGNKVIKGK